MKSIPFCLKEGNSEVYFELKEDDLEKLFTFAKNLAERYRCRDKELWMDIIQDVFITIFQAPEYPKGLKDILRGNESERRKNIMSYLFGCVKNKFTKWQKQEEKLKVESLEDFKHFKQNEPNEEGHYLFNGMNVKDNLDDLSKFVDLHQAEFSPQMLEYWHWASKFLLSDEEISDKIGRDSKYIRKIRHKFKKTLFSLRHKF